MSCFMTEASHLSSISRIVASVLDFLTGMSAVGDALLVGLLFGSGEGDLVAAGELDALGFGAGVADFLSVVTETLGSEEESFFRKTDASGEASGAGLDSS